MAEKVAHSLTSRQSFPNQFSRPEIACDVLSDPASTVTFKDTGRFGKVIDVIAADGRGLRYDSKGKFIGLLEPPKP